MDVNSKTIEDAFEARVDVVSELTDDWGLDIAFRSGADLGNVLKRRTPQDALYNSRIVNLANRYGVLRLRNVFTGSVSADFRLTQGLAHDGTLSQDTFHRDQRLRGPLGVTMLYKDIDVSRAAPTLYAKTEDVRQAIMRLNLDGLTEKALDAVFAMSAEDYGFTYLGDELHAKLTVQLDIPDFTDRVFELIPNGKKIRQDWRSGESSVVIHSNERGGVLHGRSSTTCKRKCNPLDSVYLLPDPF